MERLKIRYSEPEGYFPKEIREKYFGDALRLAADAGSELCRDGMPGVRLFFFTLRKGRKKTFPPLSDWCRVFVLTGGAGVFSCGGKTDEFGERAAFACPPGAEAVFEAHKASRLLEIAVELNEEDKAEFDPNKLPLALIYKDSTQYRDPCKSEKSISRMMIEHGIIPRFAMGSVESRGFDRVEPHTHPMLDQFFVSFKENDSILLIDGERIPFGGETAYHIPLGSSHGVEVAEGGKLHYLWIDHMTDREAGKKRLDENYRRTGTVREL